MSVLNQMLRDLEKRGAMPALVAAAGTATVARPALALPPGSTNLRRRWIWTSVLATAAALVGVHTWLTYRVQDARVMRSPLGASQFGAVAQASATLAPPPSTPVVANATPVQPPAPVVMQDASKPVAAPERPARVPGAPRKAVAALVPAVPAALPAPTAAAPQASIQPPVADAPASAAVVRSASDVAQDVDRAADLIARGRATEAMELLVQVLARQPTHAAARSSLAALFAEAGRREQALHVLLAGSEFDPGKFAAPAAQLQAEMGDLNGALQTLAKVPLARRNAGFEALHAGVAQRAGDHMTAITAYRRALAQPQPDAVWWVGLAVSLEATGEPVEARTAYSRAAAEARLPADVRRYVAERLTVLEAQSQRSENGRRASLANVF
jgi:MSHA biogenesis protein MshN